VQELAAVRSVKQAVRMLKQMKVQAPEWDSLRALSREAVTQVIEQRMQEQLGNRLEALTAAGVANRRNGSYRRWLLHEVGALQLQVPRTRTFSAVEVLGRYARRVPQLERTILAGFVLGLSTRKVGETLCPLLGERVSPATVSQIAKALDEVVAAWHRRPLANRYRALLLDGVVLKRRTGGGALRRPGCRWPLLAVSTCLLSRESSCALPHRRVPALWNYRVHLQTHSRASARWGGPRLSA